MFLIIHREAGRGYCTVNFASTKSLINTFSHSLAYKLWGQKSSVTQFFTYNLIYRWVIWFIIIGSAHLFIFHCLIPQDPFILKLNKDGKIHKRTKLNKLVSNKFILEILNYFFQLVMPRDKIFSFDFKIFSWNFPWSFYI